MLENILTWCAANPEAAGIIITIVVPGVLAHVKALVPPHIAEKLGWVNTAWNLLAANYKHAKNVPAVEKPKVPVE